MWTSENPHFSIESPQYPQKVCVWAAISQRRIIGPIFFYGNINVEKYRDEILRVFLNQLDDDELVYGYFQQKVGATAHATGATIGFLSEFYENRIISRNHGGRKNVANAVRRRARLCLQEGGSHFQHLL
ncbi:hypothetical protein Zmor_001623 [Zophobas morio]|uniref:Uncharacterized protein n=1 Tax=Zophobas morio TaxID=2755281 RepID=A0AA38J486_9CUCU|nr:hypothetical protein Zmor_001623 [Zophobas morio]